MGYRFLFIFLGYTCYIYYNLQSNRRVHVMKATIIKICIFSFLYSSLYSSQTPAQKSYQQTMHSINQQNGQRNNERIISNCVVSGQQIPPQLITHMHPGAAIGAYQHNANIAGGKK